jgi:hypothetical protein
VEFGLVGNHKSYAGIARVGCSLPEFPTGFTVYLQRPQAGFCITLYMISIASVMFLAFDYYRGVRRSLVPVSTFVTLEGRST